MDDILQRRLVTISLLVLIISFVIFCFGVRNHEIIDYGRFVGQICSGRIESFSKDESEWQKRNEEILSLSNCKNEDKSEWKVDCPDIPSTLYMIFQIIPFEPVERGKAFHP